MITKTTKLINFGIFRDFKWDKEIPEFKRFNLIYGCNRSGKTTFTSIFSACEKKSTLFKLYPENGEFEIKTDTGSIIKNNDLENCGLPIKVFNQDFKDENISFDPSNPCNPIVYVSEKDIKSKKKLDGLKQRNEELTKEFENAQEEKIKSLTTEEKFRIATAQNIKTTVGSLKIRDEYYDYDKSSLKTVLDDVVVENFIKLSDENFEKYKKIIISEVKQKQKLLMEYELNFSFDTRNISSFDDVYTVVEQLLSKRVISETLERLRDEQDLSIWVKQGFDLHKKKEEKEKCLFCQKPLDDGFLDSLSRHFSKDYEKLQSNIKTLISELENLKKDELPEDNSDLYSDLHNDYKEQAKNMNNLLGELDKWVDGAIKKLKEKFNNPLISVLSPEKPKDYEILYNKIVKELNTIIINHNTKVDNHDNEVKSAKKKLEYHLIAVAIENQDYKTLKQDLGDSIKAESKAKETLDTNNEEIKVLEQQTSNIGMAIQKINYHLEAFFGRREIQLELDDRRKGYIIKRNGQPASNLSEGEKTAIAFSYFIVKARERDFKIKDGIIFIDDPVSSFDSNFIYHCFSLIKNHFKGAGQLFVFTHNFALFNLVKEWFLRKSKSKEICEFYMIENIVKDNKRGAYLKQLEDTLRKFKSEYHFLFARLNCFLKSSSPDYADFYTIGNIARRFLEIYTDFKIPTTGDLLSKIGQLDTSSISNTEKDKVYRLIQEYSHGSDPTSTIEHIDKSESQEAIKVLMEIVKQSDAKHYELLERTLPS